MAESPEPETVAGENPLLRTIRGPRATLILLGAWSAVAAVLSLFVDAKIRGPSGGLALTWQWIPFAVLYLYCARDPERYRRVFWLALVQQASAIVGNVYHWGAGDLTLGSIVISVAVAAGLTVLVFMNLFEHRATQPEPT